MTSRRATSLLFTSLQKWPSICNCSGSPISIISFCIKIAKFLPLFKALHRIESKLVDQSLYFTTYKSCHPSPSVYWFFRFNSGKLTAGFALTSPKDIVFRTTTTKSNQALFISVQDYQTIFGFFYLGPRLFLAWVTRSRSSPTLGRNAWRIPERVCGGGAGYCIHFTDCEW